MPRRLRAFAFGVVASIAVSSGCTSREPIHLEPDFAERGIERIAVMPVIDVRLERFEQVRLTTYLRDVVHRALEKKGYTVVAGSIADEDGASVAAMLPDMSVGELADVGPPDESTLMYVYFDDLHTDYDAGGDEARIKISAVLIDEPTRSELWRDRGVGVSHLGGLLSLASPPSSEYEAVHNAVKDLFLTLPRRAV